MKNEKRAEQTVDCGLAVALCGLFSHKRQPQQAAATTTTIVVAAEAGKINIYLIFSLCITFAAKVEIVQQLFHVAQTDGVGGGEEAR